MTSLHEKLRSLELNAMKSAVRATSSEKAEMELKVGASGRVWFLPTANATSTPAETTCRTAALRCLLVGGGEEGESLHFTDGKNSELTCHIAALNMTDVLPLSEFYSGRRETRETAS